MKRKLGLILGVSAIAVLLLSVSPAFAWDPPTETHPGDAMWIEPSTVDLTTGTYTIGHKFNVTIYLNITTDSVFAYQIALLYNRTQLKAAQSGVTSPPFTTEFMTGHLAIVTGPTIDTSYLGNGSILFAESLMGADSIPTPHSGATIWIEFEVMMVPPDGEIITSEIDINTTFSSDPQRTWLKNPALNNILDDAYNSDYLIPEFPLTLIPVVFVSLTVFVVILAAKLRKLNDQMKANN